MFEKKTYAIGKVEEGEIDKPFVLKWAVKATPSENSTDKIADTAIEMAPFCELMPMGETIGTTQNTGGQGELADTTYSQG